MNKSISVFVPVYNEEGNIDIVVPRLLSVVRSLSNDYEILFVNDGSTDASLKKIDEWKIKDNNIRVINHEYNLGYGAALRSGFNNAENDFIFYTDADLPIDLEDIRKVVPFMENYDLVVGYRINREDTFRRYLYSRVYNFLLRLFLKVRVRDANFSFKCVKNSALRKFQLTAKSAFIDGELLAEAVQNDCLIKEIPVIYIPRKHGVSNFNTIKSATDTFIELINYWRNNYLFRKK